LATVDFINIVLQICHYRSSPSSAGGVRHSAWRPARSRKFLGDGVPRLQLSSGLCKRKRRLFWLQHSSKMRELKGQSEALSNVNNGVKKDAQADFFHSPRDRVSMCSPRVMSNKFSFCDYVISSLKRVKM
jgi:hypothetical protein